MTYLVVYHSNCHVTRISITLGLNFSIFYPGLCSWAHLQTSDLIYGFWLLAVEPDCLLWILEAQSFGDVLCYEPGITFGVGSDANRLGTEVKGLYLFSHHFFLRKSKPPGFCEGSSGRYNEPGFTRWVAISLLYQKQLLHCKRNFITNEVAVQKLIPL